MGQQENKKEIGYGGIPMSEDTIRSRAKFILELMAGASIDNKKAQLSDMDLARIAVTGEPREFLNLVIKLSHLALLESQVKY